MTPRKFGDVVALVPVRSRDYELVSGIDGFDGRALLGYTVKAARDARNVSRVVVSTNDERIRADAASLGADVPFLRPTNLVGPGVSLAAVLQHALEWLAREESYAPPVCVSLEIAHPLRPPDIIDQVIEALISEDLHTVFAAAEERSPFWRIDEDGALCEVAPGATRMTRPPLYRQLSGLASASRSEVVRRGRTVGDRVGVVPVRDLSALVDV